MASASEARSGAGRRTADAVAERIREKRDNNLYRRELDGLGDKGRQDRRSAQRDVEEEADGSRSVAGKRSRDAEDTEDIPGQKKTAPSGIAEGILIDSDARKNAGRDCRITA